MEMQYYVAMGYKFRQPFGRDVESVLIHELYGSYARTGTPCYTQPMRVAPPHEHFARAGDFTIDLSARFASISGTTVSQRRPVHLSTHKKGEIWTASPAMEALFTA